jgi:hypothetical protein
MKHAEWLEVGKHQAALWPGQPWEAATLAASYDLFKTFDLKFALQALRQLSAEGRAYAPAPGVVCQQTVAVIAASTPLLQDPDLTRPLTAQEFERAKRMRAALSGEQAKSVQSAWRLFTQHADACTAGFCDKVAGRCRRPGLTSAQANPWLEDCCKVGRPLYEAWREAVFNMTVGVEVPV